MTVALILLVVALVCLAGKALASDMNQEEESERERRFSEGYDDRERERVQA